jgi:hypothetical protein
MSDEFGFRRAVVQARSVGCGVKLARWRCCAVLAVGLGAGRKGGWVRRGEGWVLLQLKGRRG